MKIAIMSDSHDHIWNMRKAIAIIHEQHVDSIIHCGDFVAPFMLKELYQANIPVHGVFGNNDGDQFLLTKFSLTQFTNITLHGIVGKINLDGCLIGFSHFKEIADGLVAQQEFKLVCYGHTHTYDYQTIGNTILINPGEIMGKDGQPGFVIMDTTSLDYERISLL